jgi:GNAT superfamily N-acetyltransferase
MVHSVRVSIRAIGPGDGAIVARRLTAFGNDEKANRQLLAAQERCEGVLLVAWHEGEPVGRVAVRWAGDHDLARIRSRHAVAATVPNYPALIELEVVPELQGRGIGTQLIRRAEELSSGHGHGGLCMTVHRDNPRARALYEYLWYRDPGIGVFHTCGTYMDAETGAMIAWDNGYQYLLMKALS